MKATKKADDSMRSTPQFNTDPLSSTHQFNTRTTSFLPPKSVNSTRQMRRFKTEKISVQHKKPSVQHKNREFNTPTSSTPVSLTHKKRPLNTKTVSSTQKTSFRRTRQLKT